MRAVRTTGETRIELYAQGNEGPLLQIGRGHRERTAACGRLVGQAAGGQAPERHHRPPDR